MNQIVLSEGVEHLSRHISRRALGHSTLYQLLHTVAHKAAHLVEATLSHRVAAKRIVGRRRQVAKRVEQRAVEVEYISMVRVHKCKITK